MFAVLVVEQWRVRRNSLPLLVAAVAYALAYWLAPTQALVLAIVLSIAAGIFWPGAPEAIGDA